MVALLVHIVARIAGGATPHYLITEDLFRRSVELAREREEAKIQRIDLIAKEATAAEAEEAEMIHQTKTTTACLLDDETETPIRWFEKMTRPFPCLIWIEVGYERVCFLCYSITVARDVTAWRPSEGHMGLWAKKNMMNGRRF